MTQILLGHHIDIKNHTIHLTGEVDHNMYNTVLKGISLMPEVEELTFVLNTLGGSFYDALGIYDLIRFCGVKTKIVVAGPCMSSGAVILQAATERVAMPNSQIMIHYGEDSNDSPSTAKHNNDMLKLMKDIFAERTKVTKRTLNNWVAKDTYFSAEEALKAGLIDRIASHG